MAGLALGLTGFDGLLYGRQISLSTNRFGAVTIQTDSGMSADWSRFVVGFRRSFSTFVVGLGARMADAQADIRQ
jgi:hypothetical protein